MNFYLFKLRFVTPVRFGSDETGVGLEKCQYWAHADTFFSALALEFYQQFGQSSWEKLWETVAAGQILVSNLMPYSGDELFIPRPALILARARNEAAETSGTSHWKKKLKNIKYLPVTRVNDYLKSLVSNNRIGIEVHEFGREVLQVKVALRQGEEPLPYYVSAYEFLYDDEQANPNALTAKKNGLYFVAGFGDSAEDEWYERFCQVLVSLGYSGIGGKRTAGYGRFELEDDPALLDGEFSVYGDADLLLGQMLLGDGDYYMAISPVIPETTEIDNAAWQNSFYNLLPRQGFALPGDFQETPLKKKPVVAFAPGSCFPERLRGTVCDVTPPGYSHRVYRYGKGLYLGIKIPEVGR